MFDDALEAADAPDQVVASLDPPVARADWPLEAHGMTGSVAFDGATITIRVEDHVADRIADHNVYVPIGEVDAVEWIPASTTHRGVLRIARPSDEVVPAFETFPLRAPAADSSEVAFKLRQQAAFELVRDAIERHLHRRLA